MRLFIALLLDGAARDQLRAMQRALGQRDPGARLTRPENLHLTLAFLGEVPPGREAAVRRAMDQTPLPPLTLTFTKTGRFRRDGGDIWWAGLAANPALADVHRALTGELGRAGFPLEKRPFRPHLTLARQVDPALPLAELLPAGPFSTRVEEMHLMRSERLGGRLTYTPCYCRRANT